GPGQVTLLRRPLLRTGGRRPGGFGPNRCPHLALCASVSAQGAEGHVRLTAPGGAPEKFFYFLAQLAAGIRTGERTRGRPRTTKRRTMSERDIFDAALAIDDPAQRAAYLDGACAGQPGLREHLDSLLSMDAQVRSFLEGPAPVVTVD